MSWDLTFIYEQELRSKYMNDILRGVSRPGVYNSNMYIYTTGNTDSPVAIYLKIVKGTTLMFSNGKLLTGTTYNRNLDDTGDYLIKAVASDDIDVKLIDLNGGQNLLAQSSGAPSAPILFVGAEYLYNPVAAGATDITVKLYRPNYDAIPDISANVDPLPNEDLDAGYEVLQSFLILGTIINVNTNIPSHYYAGAIWEETGEQRWLQDNIFTARGLPDYSRSVAREFQTDLPDLIFARSIKNLFITEGIINYNGINYKIDGKTWRTQYGSGGSPGTPYESSDPTIAQGFIIDESYTDANQSAWSSEGVTLTTPSKLYVTIIFLALKGKSASSTDPVLSTLLNSDDSSYKILPITIEMDNNTSIETNTNSGALNTELFGGTTSIIPLDASINNIKRLKDFISNKSLFHKVVDYMRRNEDLKPYLNPNNGETILPIFIGFRSTVGQVYEVQTLAITSGASVAGNIDIVLNGATAVSTTLVGTETASDVAALIDDQVYPNWTALASGANVVFTSTISGPITGAFTFTDTGGTSVTASFTETVEGVDSYFDDPQTVTSGGINPTNCLTLKDLQGVPESNLNNVIENIFDIISIID